MAIKTRRKPPTGRGLTYEKVWAMFQETREQFQETREQFQETREQFQETREQFRETSKETDRKIQEAFELHKETERIVKRNSKQMGGLHRRFGEMAMHLVAPGIDARFSEMGYHFDSIATKGCCVRNKTGKILAEIDILLENGEIIIAVEVKTTPAVKDVEHHVRRLEILRDRRIEMGEKRKKILGAVAGAIYENEVKKAVCEAGFFVIEQSGDTMKIDMPDGFVPREW
jgi:hypothetical protein